MHKMKLAANLLLLTTAGTPYIYYGEEIGLSQNQTGDDIFKRGPMQWNDEEYGGFTQGNSVWVDNGTWVPWRKNHFPWWKAFFESQKKVTRSVEAQESDKAIAFPGNEIYSQKVYLH